MFKEITQAVPKKVLLVSIKTSEQDYNTLVVEGQCPTEYRCKYDPNGQEPNIDSVVDSLNDSFKRK